MEDILQTIVAHKRREVALHIAHTSLETMRARAEAVDRPTVSMSRALKASSTGIIAEFKRRSPSKGWIARYAHPSDVAAAYERSGAAAISILTDGEFFGGGVSDLTAARAVTTLPLLRKEFIVHEYQIYEARAAGADAVLLIASVLTPEECRHLTDTAHALGLETLLEIHSADEIGHILPDTDMIGVNNRHLGTFHTDTEVSFTMADKLPHDRVLVSESGISSAETIRRLREAGFAGFLIGETFMKCEDPSQALRQLIAQVQ